MTFWSPLERQNRNQNQLSHLIHSPGSVTPWPLWPLTSDWLKEVSGSTSCQTSFWSKMLNETENNKIIYPDLGIKVMSFEPKLKIKQQMHILFICLQTFYNFCLGFLSLNQLKWPAGGRTLLLPHSRWKWWRTEAALPAAWGSHPEINRMFLLIIKNQRQNRNCD